MQRRYLTLLAALAMVVAIPAALAADKKEAKDPNAKQESPSPVLKDYNRMVELKDGEKTPENFVGRQGPGAVMRKINEFRKTVPEEKGYTSRIFLGKFFNPNWGKFDDYVMGCEPVNPKGKVDGAAWYFPARGAGSTWDSRVLPFKDGVRHGTEKFIQAKWGKKSFVERAVPWVNGAVHGEVKTFFPDGNVQSVSRYVKGQLHGPSVTYNEDGKVVRKVEYTDGKKNGLMVEYWRRTFKPKKKIHYKDGLAHGTAKLYYDHGQLKMEARLWEDNYHGVQKFYHEDGELRKTVYWLMDQEVPEGKFKREYKWPPEVQKKDDKDEGDKKK